MPVTTPHFAWPFTWQAHPDGTTRAAVVEQDSVDDLKACVARIVSTRVGARDELPEFGITDLAFQLGDIQQAPLRTQIERWEPRADLDSDEIIQALQPWVRQVLVTVNNAETT
jgi:phage baseplate assembly protein W